MAALISLSASIARADMITYHITPETSQTLENPGTKFVAGCGVVALAIIVAAAISRKK